MPIKSVDSNHIYPIIWTWWKVVETNLLRMYFRQRLSFIMEDCVAVKEGVGGWGEATMVTGRLPANCKTSPLAPKGVGGEP